MYSNEQVRDLLTAYYINTDDVKYRSEYLKLEPELIAEMKAVSIMETKDGVYLYDAILDLLKSDYKRLSN